MTAWTPFERRSVAAIALIGVGFVVGMTYALGRPKPGGDPNPASNIPGWTTRETPGGFRGRVVREGAPVAGARVEAHHNKEGDAVAGAVETGADGSFELKPLASNRVYDILITAPGAAPYLKRQGFIGPGQIRDSGDIPMAPGAPVSFLVEAPEGRGWKPVEGAKASLRAGAATDLPRPGVAPRLYFIPVGEALTDVEGRVTFNVLKTDAKGRPLPYQVVVTKDGFDPHVREFNSLESQGPIVLTPRSK